MADPKAPSMSTTSPDELAETLLEQVRGREPGSIDVARSMLNDPHPLVRIAAAVALMEAESDDSGRSHVEAGLLSEDEDVQAAAQMAWPLFDPNPATTEED